MTRKIKCEWCGQPGAVQYLPQEVGRQLDHEEITAPDDQQKKLTVAILRITYRRDYLCPSCGEEWSKTFVVENQQHV